MTASERVSTAELLRRAMNARMMDVHTALPAKVESYDAGKQIVEVTPVVKRAIYTAAGDKATEQLPTIPDVPVAFPRAGGFQLSLPIAAGDHVLLVFCERDLGEWRRKGEVADPGDQRMHGLSGAVAIPGMAPDGQELSGASGSNMVMGEDGGVRVEVEPGGPMHLGTQSGGEQFVALADKVDQRIKDLEDSVIQHINQVFNAHTHSTSTGPTGTPTPTGTPPSNGSGTGASNTKAD
jgi:hypothetical protein